MDPARILDEAMALPPEQRRELALRLLDSVEEPSSPEVEEAQYQEVLRRLRDVEEGKEKLVDWEDVDAELRAKIASHGT
ncbi:addiction module protein [Nannocystis bainbridge]|uniref:Addiction module protein n=1 Tax=Nannocystis bainbridge TaxID=2995303 RepID=A0ABT5DTA9_9BACT|nr:addiction module protein [Nannocystis bainbridge]MDC0716872.1 addiction module protein [Nannocystis bainbridge]